MEVPMKYKILSVLTFAALATGCATPLNISTDYPSVKKLGIKKEDIVKMSYCSISNWKYTQMGACVLGKQSIAVYPGKSLGDDINSKYVQNVNFSDIKRVSISENLNSPKIEVVSKETLFQDFSFQISPNKQTVDKDQTLFWFNHMKSNGVKAN